jgi:hypothetical protein
VLASTGNLLAFSASAVASTSGSSTSTTIASGNVTNLRTSVHENGVVSSSHSASALATPSSAAGEGNSAKASDGTTGFASRIWQYVNFSGQLVQDMDSEVSLLAPTHRCLRLMANPLC